MKTEIGKLLTILAREAEATQRKKVAEQEISTCRHETARLVDSICNPDAPIVVITPMRTCYVIYDSKDAGPTYCEAELHEL